MKNNDAKINILKLNLSENQSKQKNKNEKNMSNKSKAKKNKLYKNKESSSVYSNPKNYFSELDYITKISFNDNSYIGPSQNKKKNIDMKNKNKITNFDKKIFKYFTDRKLGNPINLKENKILNILNDNSKENVLHNFLEESKKIKNSKNTRKNKKYNDYNNGIKIDIHLIGEKSNNSYQKIKKIISSPITVKTQIKKNNNNTHKNKSILKATEKINNNFDSPLLNIKEIIVPNKKILPIKKNSSTNNSKYSKKIKKLDNNSYNSCYNFYQKINKDSNNKQNNNYNRLNNDINNFEFYNYNNNYTLGTKFEQKKNNNKNKKYSLIEKDKINFDKMHHTANSSYTIQYTDYKRFSKSKIYNKNDINQNNKKKKEILNKVLSKNNEKIMNYEKKLIQFLCKSIENYVFNSIKKNFDIFISNLKTYSIEKTANNLLLKRLQNKVVQKNFYKNKENQSAYNYLLQKENNSDYSSIIMVNNSNIINVQRKEDEIPKNYTRGYKGKRAIYNFRNPPSPSTLTDNFGGIYKKIKGKRRNSNTICSDIYIKDNFDFVNSKKLSNNSISYNNNPNLFYLKKNNMVNGFVNNMDIEDEDKKSVLKFDGNFDIMNNNVYIPKKFQLINNSKTISTNYDEYPPNNKANKTYILNQKMIYNKNHESYLNQAQDKLSIRKYNSNKDFQNINMNNSTNYFNSNYNLFKENHRDSLNNTNDIIVNRNNRTISGKKFDTEIGEISIYKRKIKINSKNKVYKKPNKIRNQILDINAPINNNEIMEKYLNPDIELHNNRNLLGNSNNIEGENIHFINSIYKNKNNKYKVVNPERKKEVDLNKDNANIFKNIQELTVNLSKNYKNFLNKNIYNDKTDNNDDKILISSQNDFDNCRFYESKNFKDQRNIIINENYFNDINKEKALLEEVNDEISDDSIKEIIIKDLSTSDKRLNVNIKYIEMPKICKLMKKRSIYEYNYLLKYFHLDSFYIPALYQKRDSSNIYYKNYCNGSLIRNNKLKYNKILSSIIEEEEKSKAALSINNSLLSDEEFNKNLDNYSQYFIQSIKYIINLLQNIFDDKKHYFYYIFFKVLKKIKNEAFLQGLLIQKKCQTITVVKNEKKEDNDENEDNIVLSKKIIKSENKNFHTKKSFLIFEKCFISDKNILKNNRRSHSLDSKDINNIYKNINFSKSFLSKLNKYYN